MRNLESIFNSRVVVNNSVRFLPEAQTEDNFYRKTVKIFTDGSPLPFEAEFNK